MKTQFPLLFVLTVFFLFNGCINFSSEEEAKAQEESSTSSESDSAGEAVKQLEKAMESFTKSKGVKEVVNFRELQELIPNKLAGMPKVDDSGETGGAMGIKISTAEATFEKGDKRLVLNITDTGGLGTALMGIANWSQFEVDKESSDGYERTTTVDGYKAFEKYNSKSETTEIAVLVKDRYVVGLKGRNVNPDDLRDALGKLPLKKLQ